MVDDCRPFPHLSNILHQLGHELHLELTEDIQRRNDARRFEDKLTRRRERGQLLQIRTKKHLPVEDVLSPPAFQRSMTKIANQTEDTVPQIYYKKERTKKYSIPTSDDAIPPPRRIDLKKKKEKEEEPPQKLPRKLIQAAEDAISLTRLPHIDHRNETEKQRQKRTKKYSIPVGEDALPQPRYPPYQKENVKPSQKRSIPTSDENPLPPPKRINDDDGKKREKLRKKHARKCSIPAAEDAIPLPPREQQLYAPVELHCATESAVKAIDRTVNALEKIVLLAPKNSIERSLMKTISLMCVFLRQFHTELRTRKDRRSKLEIILMLWNELQKSSTQKKSTKIPSQIYRQQSSAAATSTISTASIPQITTRPPQMTISSDEITVKLSAVSSTSSTSCFINSFDSKKQQQRASK